MDIRLFTPIPSQNPIYMQGEDIYNEILETHGGTTFAEIKEDGFRLQIHKLDEKIMAFTKSMNEVDLDLFPELAKSLSQLPDCILDAEIMGWKKVGKASHYDIHKRFRPKISASGKEEYLASGIVKEFPLELRVFDTLYWERQPLLEFTLAERRAYTESIQEARITPSTQRTMTKAQVLQDWFEKLVDTNYEGLVCKRPDSSYVPDASTTDWVKLKRAETFDLVVMGVYMKEDRIGQILCGTRTEDGFETLGKVNAKREGMDAQLENLLHGNSKVPPSEYIIHPKIPSKQLPTYFVDPTVVVEIAAMNLQRTKNWHSCGLEDGKSYSLRIAWLKQIREDKIATQATSTLEIIRQYKRMK